ncbi:unknow [Vibrio campbellii]|nr:unknow [Vibrio campbellii]
MPERSSQAPFEAAGLLDCSCLLLNQSLYGYSVFDISAKGHT